MKGPTLLLRSKYVLYISAAGCESLLARRGKRAEFTHPACDKGIEGGIFLETKRQSDLIKSLCRLIKSLCDLNKSLCDLF